MGMTITEKILARHAGLPAVKPGDLVECRVDMLFANDITAPLAIQQFERIGVDRVFDPDRVAFVLDHYSPAKDIASAEQCRITREFVRKHGLPHFYDVGRAGVAHVLLAEEGFVLPGELFVGADSHTCNHGALGAFATGVGSSDLAAAMATGRLWFRVPHTLKFVFKGTLRPWVTGKDLVLRVIGDIGVDGARYAAMEFSGPVLQQLSLDERFSITNMAVEAGAKNGIMEPDEVVLEWVQLRARRPFEPVYGDSDAEYAAVYEYDVTDMEPVVAAPPSPDNVVPVTEVQGVRVDQCFIGTCTNGRIEDLRQAARVLAGRRVHPEVRLIVIPATPHVYRQALEEGLIQIFLEAGAAVSTATCGPCIGGHMGVLADGEVCVSTSSRNFIGRMGHRGSRVYLSNPAVAAAAAVAGKIVHPAEVVGSPVAV
ncbi:MAG: 3-isopropylmalate dehydratase large subunit [Armatimonadota bacterium]|nr:3-isopropylmalate dehydratase large subunit [Armatimonadota bacterium]MDR7438318.1 3-isopropylmalate dehydratase large subunit [Armatimonadota bacterium]MDR7443360.1 3-isopropylmalate dehydratase large subunit [Armatimonadota bacterium]MDR7563504.1 3-isopropylmalate dehydratase large subunit [Armatimonadota bacterium]MDR7567971.1 3-isopropylmalate dehydratase large subunit [Armatimonadota bacterium]